MTLYCLQLHLKRKDWWRLRTVMDSLRCICFLVLFLPVLATQPNIRGWTDKGTCPRGAAATCDIRELMSLEVQTSEGGYARVTWEGIPETLLSKPLALKLYTSMESSEELYSYDVRGQPSGSVDTTVPLNPGLQVRLEETRRLSPDREVWATPEFHWANRALPSNVPGYRASFRLIVKNGKACVRLYIDKTFTNWKNQFYNSWIGLYKSAEDRHSEYVDDKYVVNFQEISSAQTVTQYAYEYQSAKPIRPGFQLRFFLAKGESSFLSETAPWEGETAIRKVITKVKGYPASLQLYESGGKASARVYIAKSFTNWNEKFYYAWVGIYKYGKANDDYEAHHYVVDFAKNSHKDTKTYLAYDHDFGIDISPGEFVEIRFFPTKEYDRVLARIAFIHS